MHRHMMQALRQAFPQHTELFEGFPTFPFDAKDVPERVARPLGHRLVAQSIRTPPTMLEDIENKLTQFPTEGDLGKFIQCGGMANGASSIHGALHFKWVVNESPHSLGKQTVNIDNYMFWKLHGWIDQIWERYRVAKGLAPDEPKLKQALVEQCREMHTLGHSDRAVAQPSGTDRCRCRTSAACSTSRCGRSSRRRVQRLPQRVEPEAGCRWAARSARPTS